MMKETPLHRPYRVRMFGHRTVPKVAKMAIVIYEYTANAKNEYYTNSAQMKAKRNSRKMLLKLIERLKKGNQIYNQIISGSGMTRSEHLTHLLENSRKMKYFGVWMLQLNQHAHEIIHDLANDYDPANTDTKSSKPFYADIFKELTE